MASLYGYAVQTEIPFARLRDGPAPRGSIEIHRALSDPLARRHEVLWFLDHGGAQLGLARSGADLLVWCSATGAYCLSAETRRIAAAPRGAPEWWEHRLASTVLPLMLSECGDLCLHAAALELSGGAILVCGKSGAGKSSLSAALILAGYHVMSEDGVVVSIVEGNPVAWSGLDGVRIEQRALAILRGQAPPPDGVDNPKNIHLRERRPAGALPARALIFLEPRAGTELAVEAVQAPAALPSLLGHVHFAGRPALADTMRRAAALLSSLKILKVTFPNDLAAVSAHAEELLSAVERTLSSSSAIDR
jgi:hypothetical protein